MIPNIKSPSDGRMETETEGNISPQLHYPLFSEDWVQRNYTFTTPFPHLQTNSHTYHDSIEYNTKLSQCKCHCSRQSDNRLSSIVNDQTPMSFLTGNPPSNPFSSLLTQPQPFEQSIDLPNLFTQQNIPISSNQEVLQGELDEPSRIDDLFTQPPDQNVTLESISNQDLALSFDHGSNWDEHELWGADSQDSLIQDQDQDNDNDNDNAETSISLNHAAIDLNLNTNLGPLILNDVSSVFDPIERDIRLNLTHSNHSDTSDGEPFEKKRKLENCESKQKVNNLDNKEPQEKWQDVPKRIIWSIKRACQYYFTQKGIKLASINRVLERKAIESQKKFEKFIIKYKNTCKTWEAITNYVFEEGDNETAWILMELIAELLSNKEDVEEWLSKIKMPEKMKNHIRVSKDMLRDNFIFNFYPLSQSWIKTVY